MRGALLQLKTVQRRIQRSGCVILLDFDGTLAPIVPHHKDARMPAREKAVLRALSRKFPVAIISGRALPDLKRRVGLSGVSYAGSHGLETDILHPKHRAQLPVPPAIKREFEQAKKALSDISRRYPGIRIENKRTSFALHYRMLRKENAARFIREAREALAPHLARRSVRIFNDLYTYDIMPNVRVNKGTCARLMMRALGTSGAVALYIGDGMTDEDAFRALRGHITVRVGRSASSAARYFFRSRRDCATFLREISR